jgi:hypothetical protein
VAAAGDRADDVNREEWEESVEGRSQIGFGIRVSGFRSEWARIEDNKRGENSKQ